MQLTVLHSRRAIAPQPAYMQKNPATKPQMEQAAALAEFESGLYEVVDTQSATTPNA